jgi:hypothetical protein
MDDLFGGFGEMVGGLFGGEAGAEGAMGLAEMLAPEGRRDGVQIAVYERYLCGGPRKLNINDR